MIIIKIREKLKELESWYYHKQALRLKRKQYKQELAALRIAENYLIDLISGYQNEDAQRSKWRDQLTSSMAQISNLEMLLKFLEHAK